MSFTKAICLRHFSAFFKTEVRRHLREHFSTVVEVLQHIVGSVGICGRNLPVLMDVGGRISGATLVGEAHELYLSDMEVLVCQKGLTHFKSDPFFGGSGSGGVDTYQNLERCANFM